MPCCDQSTTCDQPPGCASSRRPLAGDRHDCDVEIDAVAARVRECDLATVGRERAGDVDRGRVGGERQLGAALGVDREERVALVAAGVARDHPELLARGGQRGGHALAAERDLLVQPVGRDAPELEQAGDVGEVAELAGGQMAGDGGRADLQVALDHAGISPRATRASDEESSPPWPESTSRCACSATRRVTSIGSPSRSPSASAIRRSLRWSSILKPSG